MIRKIFKIIMFTAVAVFISSCGLFMPYVASYDIGLKSVESPSNAKIQFGETKVVTFKEGDKNKYSYEDDFIKIIWHVGTTKFYFDLTNKSGHTLKINWDDISFVDINGKSGRVMHSGIKYNDRNNSQPASSVPKGASLSDILLPTENVYYISGGYGGWREGFLIPSTYRDEETKALQAPSYVGKTMIILMPIIIENVQNDYTFTFSIDALLNDE